MGSKKGKGKRKTYGNKEPIRSGTDLDFRLRSVRSEKMLEKNERAEKFVRKGMASLCRAVKAMREDPDREKKIAPFLGNIPDAWIERYGRIRQSAIKNLRAKRRDLPIYNYDDILDDVMLAFEGEAGLSETFRNERMEDVAPLFGLEASQNAQSANAAP